jgi:hypothetical protein
VGHPITIMEETEKYEIPLPDGAEIQPGDMLKVESVSDGTAMVTCQRKEDMAGEPDQDEQYNKDFVDYMSPKTDGDTESPPAES